MRNAEVHRTQPTQRCQIHQIHHFQHVFIQQQMLQYRIQYYPIIPKCKCNCGSEGKGESSMCYTEKDVTQKDVTRYRSCGTTRVNAGAVNARVVLYANVNVNVSKLLAISDALTIDEIVLCISFPL